MKIFTEKTLPKILPKIYIKICKDSWCEHCGGIDPYDPMICFDEAEQNWCMTCNSVGGHESISEKDAEKIFKLVIEEKTKYFTKELELIKNLKINDVVPV